MFNISRRTLLFYVLFPPLLICNSIQCSFEKPSAPSWDVEVAIPLVSKTYTMTEIANDETSLSLDSTGLANFEFEAELDTYYVEDQLDLKDLQESFDLNLGSFTVDSPGSTFTNVQLREIYPEADIFDGLTVTVPPFTFSSSKKTWDQYQDFSFVVIKSGTIDLRVENSLVVPIGSPITLEIWDSATDTVIATKTRAVRINPGATKEFIVDLAGKTLPNQLAVRIIGESLGSEGAPVLIKAADTFGVTATISGLTVTEALAQIPSQLVSDQELVTIDEAIEIREAAIENGTIELTINGNLPVDAWIVYHLPDFVSETGTALVDSFYVSKNSSSNISINLSTYSLQPQPANIGEQKLSFLWTARTIDTGTEHVLVKSSDLIHANLNLSQLRFSTITGRLDEKEIDISQNAIEVDIPVDLDSVYFETANMELTLNNGINFPATINVMIEGTNEAGAVSKLSVLESIQSAQTPGIPMTSVIVLNQQNSNIQEFISILPSLLRVFGSARLGDANWIGTVTKNDFINGTVKITAPFALKLPSQSIDSDIDEVDIADDVKQDIEDNLSSGTFYIDLSNHLPMGASIEFMFAENDSAVFDSPSLRIGPVRAEGATLDASGFVQQAQDSNNTIPLTENEMRTFLRSPLYAGVRVSIDGTQGRFVKVKGSDYLQIRAYSKIKMKINQN